MAQESSETKTQWGVVGYMASTWEIRSLMGSFRSSSLHKDFKASLSYVELEKSVSSYGPLAEMGLGTWSMS